MKTVDRLFRPWRLGSLDIPSRLVRSATMEGLAAPDGAPTPRLTELLSELALGGAGLIVAGSAYVSLEGRYAANETGIHDDALIPTLRRLCDAVHTAGGLIAAQLSHSGSTIPASSVDEKAGPFGPSDLDADPVSGAQVRALTVAQIAELVDDYAQAARRVREAGFDAVQIHAAHGYLINQFLSPARNHRVDRYGGSLAGRARLLYEIVDAVRDVVGPAFPVFVKLGAHDGFPGGVQLEEAVQIAAGLDDRRVDAIEVTAGTPEGALRDGWDHIAPAPHLEGRFYHYALAVKEAVSCPVLSVEGWRDPLPIGAALTRLDAISMSRPFIREPHLPRRWRDGDTSPATCISCNRCLESIETTSGLACVFTDPDAFRSGSIQADPDDGRGHVGRPHAHARAARRS